MRNTIAAVAFAFVAFPVLAQSADHPLKLSAFLSDFGFSYAENAGTDVSGGFGLALEYRLRRAWSADLSVAREEHSQSITTFDPAGVTVDHIEIQSYPLDSNVRYHFLGTRTRWRPYLGAGLHYVPSPDSSSGTSYDSRLSAQALGGVDFFVNPQLSIRFDLKRLLRSDSEVYDDLTKVSVGVGWGF